VAKPNRIFGRLIIFITLIIATTSCIIGINWPVKQLDQQTIQVTEPLSPASPLIPLPQETVLSIVGKDKHQQNMISKDQNQSLVVTSNPHAKIEPQSVNSDRLSDMPTPPPPLVREPLHQEVESKISPELQQLAETFPVPTEFQSKIVKKIKLSQQEKVIALTFDDGPWPRTTAQVLEILKKEDIRATFFWVGQYLKAHPEIAQQVVAEGHAIGNHTWHHWYRQQSQLTAAHEINDTAELIYKTTGIKTLVFRPPGGVLNNGLADYAKEQNYVTVMWSIDSMDYRPFQAGQLVKNVIRKAEPGSIVLMHDGGGNRATTVEALPQIIAQFKQQGYSFVTVPQLLEMNQKEQSETLLKRFQ
jgi:peptidoglycan/xylan/chitin deacetylase (PgdA/CDA1 family)